MTQAAEVRVQLWSISSLARQLDCDRRVLEKRLIGLEPAKTEERGNGVHRHYTLAAVFRHLGAGVTATGTDPAKMSPKERLDHYRALREQSAYLRESGELIPATEVIAKWTDMVQGAKSALLALPSRVSHELLGLRSRREIELKLRAHIADALEAIAEGNASGEEH